MPIDSLVRRKTKHYTSAVNAGQERIGITFKRLVFQDGRAVDLPTVAGRDIDGKIGVPGEYFSNIWRAIGPSVLVALIGRAIEPKESTTTTNSLTGNTTKSNDSVVQQVWPKISDRVLERSNSAVPYFVVDAGQELYIATVGDIVIPEF